MGVRRFLLRTVVPAGSLAAGVVVGGSANATVFGVTIDGGDAIFLAGRTDVAIPPASDPWTTGTHLIRHGGPTPEEIQETLPPFIPVGTGDVIRVLDPAYSASLAGLVTAPG